MTVCGASGCTELVADAPARTALAWPHLESVPPPAVDAFYSLRFGASGGAPRTGYYVPGAGLLAVVDDGGLRTGVDGVATWTAVPAAALGALRRAVAELRPFPRPTLTGGEIGYRRIEDVNGYLDLFSVEGHGPAAPAPADWQPIVLSGDRPNPWTDGATRLLYSPSTKQLRRGQEIVRLPAGIAADVAARAPLAGTDVRVWRDAAVGAAVALVLLGVAALAVRAARRGPRRRSPAAT